MDYIQTTRGITSPLDAIQQEAFELASLLTVALAQIEVAQRAHCL